MKALELADAYADAVSTHRLESLYGTSKSYTLEKAKERDEAHEALTAELRRLAAVEASILQAILDPENQPSQYGTVTLEKHANKVSELTDKYCALVDRLSTLMAERDALKAENERLLAANLDCMLHYEDARAELERIKALEPVAWMVYSGNLDKVPIYPPFKTQELAEVAASMIKSDTEIRSLYALGSTT